MIPQPRLINKLRELGYRYIDEAGHVQLWRKKGSTHRVEITKNKQYAVPYVFSVLRQCGVSGPEINEFIKNNQVN